MSAPFVPDTFDVPLAYLGPGFHLEPLGPIHNERDYEAWMTSIEHIRTTPGMVGREWPAPMTLAENLTDMEMHAKEFLTRASFTYSILDDDRVIGCVYIYPGVGIRHAHVRSWVRENRSAMDVVVWLALGNWLAADWPFHTVVYAKRSRFG
jgi:hypothetical protein